MDGYDWNDNIVLVRSLAKACRIINDKVRMRLPIQCGLLEVLLFELQRHFAGKQMFLETMYKALFALSYYGLMRIGEVTKSQHVLKAKDVHMAKNKDKLMMVLYSSKTHGKANRPQKNKNHGKSEREIRILSQQIFLPFHFGKKLYQCQR